MTYSLYYIGQLIDTLETIKRNNGKHITQIARDEGFQAIISRTNEMIDRGLAYKRVGISGYAGKVYITDKGRDVLRMLKEIQSRIDSDEGSESYIYKEEKE